MVQRLIDQMSAERSARIPDFTPSGGSPVEASDFVAPAGVFLVAAREGEAVGCAGLRRLGPGVGEIKRLFVSPPARGLAIARRLLEALEHRAEALGYGTLRLDTHGGEPAALALFRGRGYYPIEDYNGNPYARHWFERRIRQ